MKAGIAILFSLLISSCNSFNSDDWAVKKNRSKQINSLIRSKILINKSYDEVIQLLGKEDISTKQPDSVFGYIKFSIQYFTGGGRWIDYERLLIVFDSARVISAEKYYH